MTRRYPNSIPVRVDNYFCRDLKGVAKVRLDKGLARFNPRELGITEMTRLIRRTNSWNGVLEELKTRPKKESYK